MRTPQGEFPIYEAYRKPTKWYVSKKYIREKIQIPLPVVEQSG